MRPRTSRPVYTSLRYATIAGALTRPALVFGSGGTAPEAAHFFHHAVGSDCRARTAPVCRSYGRRVDGVDIVMFNSGGDAPRQFDFYTARHRHVR